MNREQLNFVCAVRDYANKYEIKELLEKSESEKKTEPLFAAVCIAAEKGLGQIPFDEQLAAAKALIEGKILELPTGEGKTLCAVFAAAWLKLCKKKVHILTFNDYLAERDRDWMAPVYELLNISVAVVKENSSFSQRKKAYSSDVLYISAKERCFDYLRDFTVQRPEEAICGGFEAAIVDEADSLLIDEARIPMIVAGDTEVKPDAELFEIIKTVKTLSEEDYEISLEAQSVYLTDEGAAKLEEHFKIDNIYDTEHSELLGKINDSLKAEYFLKEDEDYICKDGRILLIDKFTGRVAKNRSYPGSLQSAVELKHGLTVTARGVIMGSIALQFFVRKYDFLAAMTGTAETAEEEFYEIYDLPFEKGEPHLPSQRIDHEMQIYFDSESKQTAVVNAIEEAHSKNQPVLVGAESIAASNKLYALLKEKGIEAIILNAKNDKEEAEIIKDAGSPGTVTISTNMAGRGVDIRLGGKNEERRNEVVQAGGLLVISTYMPESSRIVKQLLGRSGRQGDPGESRRFVSLDEPIMERYKLNSLLPQKHIPSPTSQEIEDKILLREVERIGRISEGDSFDRRTRLMKFTMIGEKHREPIFAFKSRILSGGRVGIWENSPLYSDAVEKFKKERLEKLEQKTALAAINYFWSDYLEYTENIRRGIHLVAVGGKSPSEEYNIAAEDYYVGIEEELKLYMYKQLERLYENGEESYTIEVPKNIRTYLLEDTGDELNKMPFLLNIFEETDDAQTKSHIQNKEEKNVSVLEKSEIIKEPKKEKKGFLFWKKR